MAQLYSDSEQSSLLAYVPQELATTPKNQDYAGESQKDLIIGYCGAWPTSEPPQILVWGSSARPERFSTNVFIGSPHLVSVFAADWRGARYLVCQQGRDIVERSAEFGTVVRGPSRSSSATERWLVHTAFESEFGACLSRLHAVVGAIREGRQLGSTRGFEELLSRAAQVHGTPDNIEEWARQLAEDTSNLGD